MARRSDSGGEVDSTQLISGFVTSQMLSNAGLNPFAVTLLLESFQSGLHSLGITKTSFIYQGNHSDAKPFRVTIESVPVPPV